MLKFLLSYLSRVSVQQAPDPALRLQWIRDPLSHPILDAMSERELADLPFRR